MRIELKCQRRSFRISDFLSLTFEYLKVTALLCVPFCGSPKLVKLQPDDFCSADIKCSYCESSINQEPWRSDLYVQTDSLYTKIRLWLNLCQPPKKIINRSDRSSTVFSWGGQFGMPVQLFPNK